MNKRSVAFLPLLVAGAACAAGGRPPVTPMHADKIILVGDSTTAVHSGWGASFCGRHVTSFVACVNLARGGRSTYSYRAEGSWEIVRHELRSGGFARTWVLIQFGHNDQPGKPERSTELATEFPANLRRYVREARADGAMPVLVTPLTRRQFKDGRLIDDLAPWAEAIRGVAAEMRVPLVDLHARSAAAVQAMGPVAAMQLAQLPPSPQLVAAALNGTTVDRPSSGPSVPAGIPSSAPDDKSSGSERLMAQARLAFDYTHLGPAGAELFATLVTDELARAVPELRERLVP